MPYDFEQQFAEQAPGLLSAILEQSQECILLIGRSGTVDYINRAGRAHLGLDEQASLTASQWLAYWPDPSRVQISATLEEAWSGEAGRLEILAQEDRDSSVWCEIEISPIHGRSTIMSHVLVIARDVSATVAQRHRELQRRQDAEREASLADSIAREMRHRFKNQLAVISSLLRLTTRNVTDISELNTRFEERLAALGRAQDFLSVHRGEQMTAAEAIRQIVGASGAGERVTIGELPDATLTDDAVQSLALILGELQTNALKYGALSSPEGGIDLSARVDGRCVAIRWEERGPSPISPPTQQGGGLKLLDRMGSAGGGRASTEWQPHGLIATFFVRLVPP